MYAGLTCRKVVSSSLLLSLVWKTIWNGCYPDLLTSLCLPNICLPTWLPNSITTSVTADRSIHPEDAAAEERGAGQVSQEEGKGVPPSELPADSLTSTAAATTTTTTKGGFAAAPLWEFAAGAAGVDSGVGAATGLL